MTVLGAEALLRQLRAADVQWVFGNPGTTEQTVVDALQHVDGIELVLALHEGVAVGAAEGYARTTGDVGVVQLHAAPGLGNGIGHIYNAYVSRTPLLVYVGQSEQRGLYQEPILSGDLVSMARPVTKWSYEVRTTDEIPAVVRRALKVALTPPAGPVLLSVPMDLVDAPCSAQVVAPSLVAPRQRPDLSALSAAAKMVEDAVAPALVLGDGVAASHAVAAAGRLADLIGAPIFEGSAYETVVAPDDPLFAGRLPADPDLVAERLRPYDLVIAVGTRVLAQLFPRPGLPLGERAVVHVGSDPWELAKNQPALALHADELTATEELVDALTAHRGQPRAWADRRDRTARMLRTATPEPPRADEHPSGDEGSPIPVAQVLRSVAARIPADAVVVDETMSAYELATKTLRREPGRWFRGGGGIGMGLPRTIGAKVGAPGAPVVGLVGDGASLYSLTALWTAAHHDLDVVWVILDNRSYRTLKQNVLRSAVPRPPTAAFVGTDLVDPPIDFSSIARGLGVDAWRVDDVGDLDHRLEAAFDARRPVLLDVGVDGRL